VNAGDLVAMQAHRQHPRQTATSGFAQANETVNGGPRRPSVELRSQHLGAGKTPMGGGDHDYNDLVVGIDFTSTSGHGWLDLAASRLASAKTSCRPVRALASRDTTSRFAATSR